MQPDKRDDTYKPPQAIVKPYGHEKRLVIASIEYDASRPPRAIEIAGATYKRTN